MVIIQYIIWYMEMSPMSVVVKESSSQLKSPSTSRVKVTAARVNKNIENFTTAMTYPRTTSPNLQWQS